MDILQAKQTVIDAGKELLACGLIVRTWGNISCRINDTQFVITPSGKPYEGLTPDDIVVVNIEDLSYEGNIKPSSEKGIHADCYKARNDVNFVIHTHQSNASAVSILKKDIINDVGSDLLDMVIPCAEYGLPGQPKLRQGVNDVLARSDSKAILMAHHGAVCMGADYAEAFAVANELERVCGEYIDSKYKRPKYKHNVVASKSEFKDGVIHFTDDFWDTDFDPESLTMPPEQCIHRDIYNAYPKVKYIIHCADDDVVEASSTGKKVKPYLDDFAQLVGINLKCASEEKQLIKKLRFRNGVLLKDKGGYCCANDEYNATAVEIVMKKNCKAMLDTQNIGKIKPIKLHECLLMRIVYKLKYSKQADK
ncbi:MAG: class II aldolase/adducin family protein [Clostridia bacterium]|nr:class II aldolase/adducin family protein [Clostridia bacterium]